MLKKTLSLCLALSLLCTFALAEGRTSKRYMPPETWLEAFEANWNAAVPEAPLSPATDPTLLPGQDEWLTALQTEDGCLALGIAKGEKGGHTVHLFLHYDNWSGERGSNLDAYTWFATLLANALWARYPEKTQAEYEKVLERIKIPVYNLALGSKQENTHDWGVRITVTRDNQERVVSAELGV